MISSRQFTMQAWIGLELAVIPGSEWIEMAWAATLKHLFEA